MTTEWTSEEPIDSGHTPYGTPGDNGDSTPEITGDKPLFEVPTIAPAPVPALPTEADYQNNFLNGCRSLMAIDEQIEIAQKWLDAANEDRRKLHINLSDSMGRDNIPVEFTLDHTMRFYRPNGALLYTPIVALSTAHLAMPTEARAA